MEKIRVGKLVWAEGNQKLSNLNSLPYAMMLISELYNVELFCFGKGDVDLESGTINGLFLENKLPVRRVVPIPPLIDNSQSFPGLFSQQLAKHARLVQPFRKPGKLRTYEKLVKDGRYADWLIPTVKVSGFADVESALAAYDNKIVLKAVNGVGGESVFAVSKTANSYEIHLKHDVESLTAAQAVIEINKILTESEHIAQPYIRSQTIFGEPCDLRIHCRRGKGGRFFVNIFPRIGSSKGIVSNISSGGYSIDSKRFFTREFDERGKIEHNRLLKFGEKFADYYQSLFPRNITSNVGLDVGFVRRDGGIKYYIFEVNAYIGNTSTHSIRITDSINHLEYYHYLWNKHKLGR
jgi:glutathione synthase/RimK-type ligase-like ATP-grasp enzyme